MLDVTVPLTLTKRGDFGAVAADGGAAEEAGVGFGAVEEPKGAAGAGAVFHECGLLGGDEKGDWSGNEGNQFVR